MRSSGSLRQRCGSRILLDPVHPEVNEGMSQSSRRRRETYDLRAQGSHVAGLLSLSSRLLEPQQTHQMLDPSKGVAAIDKVGIMQHQCLFASRQDSHDIILSRIVREPTGRAGLPCHTGVQRQCNHHGYQAPSQRPRDSGGSIPSCSTNGIRSTTP